MVILRKGNFVFAVVFIALQAASLCVGSVYTYGGSFDLPIPGNPAETKGWMDDAVILVPDNFILGDIDVKLTITHTQAFDLQLYLQSPAGTRICLNQYDPFTKFFNGENYIQTIFDDEAALPIEQGTVPFTGSFRPIQALSVFDGENSFGQWRLQIYDAYFDDRGTLNNFELIITDLPEPSTALLFAGGLLLARFFSYRRR